MRNNNASEGLDSCLRRNDSNPEQSGASGVDGRRGGMVLVLVLWVLVMLGAIAAGLAQRTRLDNNVRVARADRVTARWLARAGVHKGLAAIGNQGVGGYRSQGDEAAFKEQQLDGGSFSVYGDGVSAEGRWGYGLVDQGSKVNVNTATAGMLAKLPGMNDVLSEAIIRYRRGLLTQGRGTAAEGEYGGEVVGPATERGPIETIRQLALVEGMSAALLYGEDANLDGILQSNENDGDESVPHDNRDGVLDRGLLSYVTVSSYEYNEDGLGRRRVNINEASVESLEIELGLDAGEALWIVENRLPMYQSIGELLADSGAALEGSDAAEGDAAVGRALTTEDRGVESVRPSVATFKRIADRLTVSDAEVIYGRVNVNTAGPVVLRSLAGIDDAMAEAICRYRDVLGKSFESVAEVLEVPGMTVGQFRELVSLITVRSRVYGIGSCGMAGRTGLKHIIEAVVAQGRSGLRVLEWREEGGEGGGSNKQ